MNFADFLAAPEIVRRLTSQDAFENETVTFTCTVQNVNSTNDDESYSITWFFGDQQIKLNNEKYSVDENPKTGICLLTIRHITAEDEGAYRCVATNKYGSSVTTGFLAVLRRKRSHSPSPSRNASPSRSLSPSSSRVPDRSVSPLRYINLPVSKLARVTEELESLINPTASIVHEEEEEEDEDEEEKEKEEQKSIEKPEEIQSSIQQVQPAITKIVEPEESIVLPHVLIPTPITTVEEDKSDVLKTEVSN
ncbi:unnamed protein product [Rotaria sp. Silwood2]|nr:unnamed protein product [Rotaria sp. Silwood2]CAF2702780.1 unnamed protein product [Rotaria sp. Silwood2]CAF2983643.1 unnamed protein product [Rotaria sp. Silwood2]CAF3933859.1 unnamed protein product [Rotaria sp. Silwood2]CAF4045584.1 unnamed protein product [Rotaria sp. Silwood2]